jgi:hypothetical protein
MTHQKTTSRELIIGTCAIALGIFFVLAFPTQSEAYHPKTATSTATSTHGIGKNKDIACMQTAVGVRETAITAAWSDFSSSTVIALAERKAALNAAWGLTDMKARTAAIVKAMKAWRTASMKAHKELRSDRKAAWDTFMKTAKNECKMTTPKEDTLEKASSDTITI